MRTQVIAHRRQADRKNQSVPEHLYGVSKRCGQLTAKIGLADVGELLGLLHDLGKYSSQFQDYIQSATGLLNPDIDEEYVEARALKGKIDHSTAGAQWVWKRFHRYGSEGSLVGQIFAVCLASHHGGLLDCLRPDGGNGFLERMKKDDARTHLKECIKDCDQEILTKLESLASKPLLRDTFNHVVRLFAPDKEESDTIKHFRVGFFTRFLFSCLVDADRIDSADFENPGCARFRTTTPVDWKTPIGRLERELARLPVRTEIDPIRRAISDRCKNQADNPQGIYTLTVPTGGGKTYASMRFALHHARKHKLDRVIYVIPYTSIIEQNAEAIRKIIEREGDHFPWVLEHHSNLEPEQQTWRSKVSSENWDSPIIFTTMVQFLDALFGGGTRGARRMHQIANSVLIFDEIQSLPIKCVHLFCNALQFFVDHTGTTAVLCTATQPLLDDLRFEGKGQLSIPDGHELIEDTSEIFEKLKRVRVKNRFRSAGWTEEDISDLAVRQFKEKGNCLVIVNTKRWAQKLYERCRPQTGDKSLFLLSTSLCPAHRKMILNAVRRRLDDELPVLCISTQLIEAGVDVDFNSVIRFLAGMDSIAQAAGRCNRNAKQEMGTVYVVNPKEEAIDRLPDIKEGREESLRIFSERGDDFDCLSPEVMTEYFKYYFFTRTRDMDYPLTADQAGRSVSLLSLLSDNRGNIGVTQARPLRQSFKTAGQAFKAIDAPTRAVIVPYGEGEKVIADLCGTFEPAKAYELLKRAQKYSVNIFPHIWEQLKEKGAINPIQKGEEVYCLDKRYYSGDFGLTTEASGLMETLIE